MPPSMNQNSISVSFTPIPTVAAVDAEAKQLKNKKEMIVIE
jgi:hypothetical protein